MGRLGNGKVERKVASGYLSVLSPGKPFFPWCCGLWPASVSRREPDLPDVPDAASLHCIPGSGNASQIPRKKSEQREYLGSSVNEMFNIGIPRKRSERACLGSSVNEIYSNSLSRKKSEQRNPSVSSLNMVFSTAVPRKKSEQREPSISGLKEVFSTSSPRKKSETREPLVGCLNGILYTSTPKKSEPQNLSSSCQNVPLLELHKPSDDEDDTSISEELSPVPMPLQPAHSKSASPSPVVNSRKISGSVSSGDWPPGPEDDIDRLVAIHQQRHSLSSLGNVSPEPLSESTPTLTRAVFTSAESEPESAGAELRYIFSRRSSAPPRSDSLASVYSGAGEGRYGTVAVRGEVEFGLQYNYKASALEIHVKQCRDLAPVDLKRNRSDPYVKVYLLPDKSKSGKRKTKVKKHTLNPVFDETLKFHMTLHGLETRTLWLTVWHSDMFGRNDFLGEVMMALENKVFDDPTPQWYHLQERTEPFDDLLSYKGDIIIGLKFVPPDVTVKKKGKRSRGSLHVLVKEAKNLVAVKANGKSDPFCKSYLLPDKGRSSKQKTPVLRHNVNPVWNYTFVYEDVSLQELSERSLELTVWDHDRLASNEFLGGLRFNLGTGKHYGKGVDWMDATGKEMTLWQSMLERPNFWVEGSLTLRPSLEQHRTS